MNIISFTTIPNRIDKIEPTIKSILNQTVEDYRIILWVSDSYDRLSGDTIEIPQFITKSKIEVRYVKDIGPLTKLFYAIKENWGNDNVNVITCDDDVIYPETWLEDLIKTSKFYPNWVIGYRGRVLLENLNYCHSILIESDKINTPTTVNFITGTWGALYKPTYFNECFLNPLPEFFNNDDIWIYGCLKKTNVPYVIIPKKGIVPNASVYNIDDLHTHNVGGEGGNCEGNNKMLKHFK